MSPAERKNGKKDPTKQLEDCERLKHEIVKAIRELDGSLAEKVISFFKGQGGDHDLRQRMYDLKPAPARFFRELGATCEDHPGFGKNTLFYAPNHRFLFPDGSSIVYTVDNEKHLGWGSLCWCLQDWHGGGHRSDCVAYFSATQKRVEAEIKRLGLDIGVLTVVRDYVVLSYGNKRELVAVEILLRFSRELGTATTSAWWNLVLKYVQKQQFPED
ncbi:MAG: hypothetical protein WC645_07945 [Candidatus Margulisiibacteriota bacterium]